MRNLILILIASLVISSCSIESRMLKSDKACLICDEICDVRDSIYIERIVERVSYDTVVKFLLSDEWIVASEPMTDTVYVQTEVSEAYSYVDNGAIKIALRNNKNLKKTITLYRERITEKTERFEKSQALNKQLQADYNETLRKFERAKKTRNILIIILIVVSLILFSLRKISKFIKYTF